MAIIGIFTMESVKLYSAQHPEMWILAMVIMFVSLITLACCEGVRRKTPHNFIFLGLFTLAEGFMLGTITAKYNIDEVQYFNIRLCSTYGPRLEITDTSSVMPVIQFLYGRRAPCKRFFLCTGALSGRKDLVG